MPPLAGGSTLGDLYSKCVQLVNENKISTKNAFDLPLIEHMDDIVDSFMGGKKALGAAKTAKERRSSASKPEDVEENRFHEASCTIEASARIYACRVDCVHTDTYRILGGLNSADMGDEEDGQPGEEGKGNAAKKRRICGVNTLEKNEANLIQQTIEADEQSDPMFRRMAAAFDAGGAKGLLLSHLPIAEDMSLVFNGDVPLKKAAAIAEAMFATPQKTHRSDALGFGDPQAAAKRIAQSKLCPELDEFRKQIWGDKSCQFSLPKSLEDLLGAAVTSGPGSAAAVAAVEQAIPIMDGDAGLPDNDDNFPEPADYPEDASMEPTSFGDNLNTFGESFGGTSAPSAALVPITDAAGSTQVLVPIAGSTSKDDVLAFDELFDKFCTAGGHQFAYFDECWSKTSKEKDSKALPGALADAQPEGALVASSSGEGGRERAPKRPLFDLSGLDKPAKPIETEPVQKHQLSEKAAQWQLQKDVPPYMIDRITMPSWQTWSKCDFACLGLRPHLMLKLVRKPQPPGEGPHGFSDLFSTVVVENPEAFPWLAASEARASGGARRGRDDEDDGRYAAADQFGEDGGDDDFDGTGLPAHLDIDPQDLFLGPDDQVVTGVDGEGGHEDDGGYGADLDFELAEKPLVAENIDIGYSSNSKFVDVKLVKKHLWDCINQDILNATESKATDKKKTERIIANDSFQDLVSRTVRKMPKGETENLSVAVCFICALHLCNEKNLELKTDQARQFGDFAIVAPP